MKIADFGISKIAHKDDAQTNKHPTTRIGTPGYMAPERLGLIESISSSHTPAIDIWSLGCLIHYILTGTIPFTAQNSPTPNSYAALEDYCTGARGLSEDHLAKHRISLSGRSFLRRLLAPNPQDRPVASRELMIDWEFPPSISNGTTLTTERSNGSVPASNLNTSQELFYVDQYSQGFVTELEMVCHI